MAKVQFRLEEQFADFRSNEVAYRFTIENLSSSTIELLSITPRIPENVSLVEIRDPSLIALKSRHSELCNDLETLLRTHMEISLTEFRNEYARVLKESMQEMFSGWGILNMLWRSFLGKYEGYFEEKTRETKAFEIQIENHRQAQEIFNQWKDNDSKADKTLRDLYEIKLQRLEAIEKEIGPNLKTSSLATIESESFFAITYVLKFRRNLWDTKKYNIAIEGVYSDVGKNKGKHYVGGTTISLTISPSPAAMTLVAVGGSILGLMLKITTNLGVNRAQVLTYPSIDVLIFQAVASVILALIFFNIYEFTDIGKKMGGAGAGWRSALLIGALCGIFEDRIFAAFKTLLGI